MEIQDNHSAEEVKRLQRCINDLVGMLALPALWSGGNPTQIARTLIDVLQRMLGLELIYVELKDPIDEAPREFARVAPSIVAPTHPSEIGAELRRMLGDDRQQWPLQSDRRFADVDLSIVPMRLGLHGEMGMVVAGSERTDFPSQTDELLLRMATNQAVMALREARLLYEQKRVADELDVRVAQRTKELAVANQKLQLQVDLLQQIPVATWTIRPDGTPDFINMKWVEYTGQAADYVLSAPEAWMTAMHPDDRDAASTIYWEGIRAGRSFAMETRFRRGLDGAYRWHLNRAVALHDEHGRVVKFVGTSTDIEDLKNSQEELHRTEERASLIVDTASDAVVTMDITGTITSWNKQAEVIFGWSSTEAVGLRLSELIVPPFQWTPLDGGQHYFPGADEGGVLQRRIEATAIRRSGVEFPVELEVIPMRLSRDLIFSAFIRDITESKLAEEKLRRSELNLRQLTETIPEMLWSATPEGEIDYCNSRLLEYTGFAAQDVMGAGWLKLIHADDVEPTVQEWMSCVASGSPYRVEVRTVHASDRTYRWCVVNAL
ncbi:MAG TPA: PAS domain S-box protein, partial [Schlesneria sp.]